MYFQMLRFCLHARFSPHVFCTSQLRAPVHELQKIGIFGTRALFNTCVFCTSQLRAPVHAWQKIGIFGLMVLLMNVVV